MRFPRTLTAVLGMTAAVALLTSGCATNAPKTQTPSASTTAQIVKNDAAAALVPAAVATSGVLQIGTNLTYAPDEFKNAAGEPIGWGIELMTAISKRLGLTPKFQDSQFDNIIPGIKGGKYQVGIASFTDTKERQNSVDFVDYFTAGGQWASKAGTTIDPDNACGKTVAVGTGTYQETDEIPARSKACTDAGKPAIIVLKLDTQQDITTAVALGRADALSADSPVTQYAVSQTEGKLQLAGPIFDSAPFGIAVAKDSGTLTQAVQTALQSLIDDGTYGRILTTWGVSAGAITRVTINGGTS